MPVPLLLREIGIVCLLLPVLPIEMLVLSSVTLSWDAKTDIRAGFNDADLYYKMSGDYQDEWFDTTITIPLPGSAPDHAETFTFNIQTVVR